MIYQYPPWERSYHGDDGNVWNLTKGALLTCDRVLTVSAGYAEEMKTSEGEHSAVLSPRSLRDHVSVSQSSRRLPP
eukprot:g14926.t1